MGFPREEASRTAKATELTMFAHKELKEKLPLMFKQGRGGGE